MIVNGKEVLEAPEDYKRAAQIQTEVNKVESLPAELKRAVSKKEMEGVLDVIDGYNTSMFDDFEEDSSVASRREAIEVYKEMSNVDVICKSLEIVSDNATQSNQEGNVIAIYSDDESIKARLDDLFINRLDLNNELWSIVLETSTIGDGFFEIQVDDLDKPKKVMGLKFLEPERTERVEINDKLAYFNYKMDGKKLKQKDIKEITFRLQPWQVAHFRLENRSSAPYGASVLRGGVRAYRRLILLEDISLVYRISRAPERRVFKVPVGQMNKVEAQNFLRKFKDNYRTQPVIDEHGKLTRRASVMSITQDIFIPVREGEQSVEITPLQGGSNILGGQDDLLKYLKDKIVRLMNIPPAYLGDESDRSRGSLAAVDVNFSKFTERIQSHIIKTLNKVASLDLYFAGYKKEALYNFSIELTPPSNIKEITELEFISQKMTLVQTMMSLNIFPLNYVLKKVFRMTDKEIANIQLYKKLEAQMAQQEPGAGEIGGAEMAMGAPGGLSGASDMGGMDMGVPGAENAAMALPTPDSPLPDSGAEGVPQESTMLKILGKEFLIENQRDFFKVLKFAELSEKVMKDGVESSSYLIEAISGYLMGEKKTRKTSQNISHLRTIGEFSGIDFKDNSIKYFTEAEDDKGLKFDERVVRLDWLNG